jgi:pimeloyl-ACP methyl ester carboxylesterase
MPIGAAYIARGLFPKPEQEPYRAAAIASLGKNSKRAYFAAINVLRTFDTRAQLRAIQCPTLVIAGDRDTTIPLSAKEVLYRAIPGAQMLVIPDSGHATPYDQTEQFNDALLAFLAAH